MLKGLLTLLLFVGVAVAGGLWYMSDTQVERRAFGAVNAWLNDATASRNIPALTQFLKDTLDEKSTVSLKVEYTVLGVRSNTVLMSQDFNKADFIRFMELTLEPTESYSLSTRIEDITRKEDGSTSVATYASGSGKSGEYANGLRVPTIHTVQARCTTDATRDRQNIAFTRMQCSVGLGRRAEAMSPADVKAIMDRATGATP